MFFEEIFGRLKANYFVLNDPNDQTINDPKRKQTFFSFSKNENENKEKAQFSLFYQMSEL